MNQDSNQNETSSSSSCGNSCNAADILKNFEASVETMKQVVLNPVLFFKNLDTSVSSMRPAYFFAASMGFISGVLNLVLSIFGLGQHAGFFMSLVLVILFPLICIIGAYIVGAIFHICWKFLGSSQPYQIAVICAIYMLATSPFTFIFAIFPYIGTVAKMLWLGYLVYLCTVHVHKISDQKAKIACVIGFGILTLMSLSAEHSTRKAVVYLNELSSKMENQSAEEAGKMVGDFLKGLNSTVEKDRQNS